MTEYASTKTTVHLMKTTTIFSEKDLIVHFRGESREMKKFILDAQRDGIIRDPKNKLKDYVDFGGRGKEKPLSY